MPIQAIIFDMDGLMVDTEPLSLRAWNNALAPYDRWIDDALYGRVVGRSGAETVRILRAELGLEVDPDALAAAAGQEWLRLLQGGVPMMPGIEALHAALRARHIPWAVATASPRPVAELIVGQLAYAADCRGIASGSDVAHSKPAPDVYLLAAAQVGIDPPACLALEDSLPGCRAAMAAGMTTIAVPGSHTDRTAFKFADGIAGSLGEVLERLPELLAR